MKKRKNNEIKETNQLQGRRLGDAVEDGDADVKPRQNSGHNVDDARIGRFLDAETVQVPRHQPQRTVTGRIDRLLLVVLFLRICDEQKKIVHRWLFFWL